MSLQALLYVQTNADFGKPMQVPSHTNDDKLNNKWLTTILTMFHLEPEERHIYNFSPHLFEQTSTTPDKMIDRPLIAPRNHMFYHSKIEYLKWPIASVIVPKIHSLQLTRAFKHLIFTHGIKWRRRTLKRCNRENTKSSDQRSRQQSQSDEYKHKTIV